jgi:3-keto-disaccharide hydrolase/Trehalose utilisation
MQSRNPKPWCWKGAVCLTLVLAGSGGSFLATQPAGAAEPPAPSMGWQPLFDGKTLAGWAVTDFAGHGDVTATNGQLVLQMGATLTGVNWTNPVPKTDYEVELDARKLEGNDFLCGLTFPVADSFCSFIVGGWGGGVVGLSSIDGMDASENQTTQYRSFDKGRWYHIRVRVTRERIQAWLDHELMADVVTRGHRITLRYGDIELSKPLGLATYVTTAAMRNIRLRTFPPPRVRKLALVAGRQSLASGGDEYARSLRLFQRCLATASNVAGVETRLYTNGWPTDPHALDDADTIVLYGDGADRGPRADPLLNDDHLAQLGRLMQRGVGLVVLHDTLAVPGKPAETRFLDWVGGCIDSQANPLPPRAFSKRSTGDFTLLPVTPHHPVLRGVHVIRFHGELYQPLRFRPDDPHWVPLLSFGLKRKDPAAVVAWAVERADGGRGFGYSGGRLFANWEKETLRRLVLNAILWTAKAHVPLDGVRSSLETAEGAAPTP